MTGRGFFGINQPQVIFIGGYMFEKVIIASFCFLSFIYSSAQAEQEKGQVGRYQMAVSPHSHTLYLLDTTTGRVWYSERKDNWYTHDRWVLQIATPPEHPEG